MGDFSGRDSDFGKAVKLRQASAAERERARLTAARYAQSADDLRLLLAVLGLDDNPGAPLCRVCGGPISRLHAQGYNQRAGDGMCSRCFVGALRLAKEM